MTSAGRTLSRNLTLPIVGLGFAAGKMSLSFEKAMTNIRALVGASDQQMEEYQAGVLALAETVPQGPQVLADALYFVTSSGFEGAAALAVLEASAKAAAAGLGETEQVARIVGAAVNAYGEENLKASEATDVLLATVREGTAEPEELAQVLGRVLAPAQAVGVEFGELGGAVAGLTLGGLDAAEAVTALRGVLSTFLKPTSQTRDLLEDAGTSIAEVRKQVAEKGLLPALQDLRDRFGDNQDALGKLFPNVRALNGFLALTGANAEKNAAAMDDVTDSVGDTNKAFAEASEDAQFQLERAWSQMRVALIEAGGDIIPVVTDVVSGVAELASGFGDLDSSAQRTLIITAGLVAALGPAITVVGNLTLAVRTLGVAFTFAGGLGGVLIVTLGLLAGAMIYGGLSADRFTEATNRAKDALEAMKPAADEAAQADIDLASARNRSKIATQQIEDAERTLRQAMKGGNDREIARARTALTSARIAGRQATLSAAQAEERAAAATRKAREAHARGKQAVGNLTRSYQDLQRESFESQNAMGKHVTRQRDAAQATRDFADDMRDLAAKAEGTRSSLAKTNPGLARTAGNARDAASAAAALADSLGRIPSKKEVNIFLRTTEVITRVEETRLQGVGQGRQHGGPVRGGVPYVVGESGRELYVPESSGVIVPNRVLEAAGAGGDLGGLLIRGRLDVDTGELEGRIVGRIEDAHLLTEQRRRMGAGV